MNNNTEVKRSGAFRPKRINFAQVSNIPLWQKELSWGAKGLYSTIQSLITIPNYILYKTSLMTMGPSGKKAFDRIWKELKEKGYLIQYRLQDPKTKAFYYEYELLDEPNVEFATEIHNSQNRKTHIPKKEVVDKNPCTQNGTMENPCTQKAGNASRGVYNNTLNNNTVSMYVSIYEKHLALDGLTENFIRNNNLDEKIELDLFETILVEAINNKRVKLKDRYFRKKITEIINKGIRTIQDYEKSIEDFNKTYEVSNSNSNSKSYKGAKNRSKDNYKTKFHNFDSNLENMSNDEVMENLAINNYVKHNDKREVHKIYLKAMNLGLSSLATDDIRKSIVNYAIFENLEVPK